MQAGMSASSVTGTPSRDTMILWLTCSYFVISAIGVCVTRRKSILRTWCKLVHFVLLAAFCLLCSEAGNHDIGTFVEGLFVVSIGGAICFSPWFAIWKIILINAKEA
jgi:hypothetical protein